MRQEIWDFFTELVFENLPTKLCIRLSGAKERCKSWFMYVLSTAPKATPGTAKATATRRPASSAVIVYPLGQNVSPLQQAVTERLSQEKA